MCLFTFSQKKKCEKVQSLAKWREEIDDQRERPVPGRKLMMMRCVVSDVSFGKCIGSRQFGLLARDCRLLLAKYIAPIHPLNIWQPPNQLLGSQRKCIICILVYNCTLCIPFYTKAIQYTSHILFHILKLYIQYTKV